MISELNRPPIKLYRGAYNYFSGDSLYAEESFEVFKDLKDLSINFKSQILSRVATGELLKIDVDYTIGKDWMPRTINLIRTLGKQNIQELYYYDPTKNLITYRFTDSEGQETTKTTSTPPRFHINTPATCCNFLFLLTKKFDINGKNHYTVYSSTNQWSADEDLLQSNITLYRNGPASDPLIVGKSILHGDEYFLVTGIHQTGDEASDKLLPTTLYLSKYMAIPYLVHDPQNGLKVQVKYFNNLDPDA